MWPESRMWHCCLTLHCSIRRILSILSWTLVPSFNWLPLLLLLWLGQLLSFLSWLGLLSGCSPWNWRHHWRWDYREQLESLGEFGRSQNLLSLPCIKQGYKVLCILEICHSAHFWGVSWSSLVDVLLLPHPEEGLWLRMCVFSYFLFKYERDSSTTMQVHFQVQVCNLDIPPHPLLPTHRFVS